MNNEPTYRERVLGGLWGAVVGDALGVPVYDPIGFTQWFYASLTAR